MAHRLLRDAQADGWERSDFPIICESCLGDNPYVRMMRAEYDKECKICARPFTVFRWRPGRDARYKKTEICQTCCKLKNVCQVCLLDLEYGLPVQVRDTALALGSTDVIPRSDVNREYFAEEHDRKARAGIDYESSHGKVKPNDTILKLQRTTPYYKRNRAHVCSFFIRGECTRGAECPYRHEMPETGELSQQNIKDRYYGVNDPVALKLLGKAGEMPSLQPPEDESIRTLYVGGLDERVTDQDLRDHFYAHGEIETIRMVVQRACAFVTYTTREAAETAAEELANKLVVKGLRLKLMWGRPQQKVDEAGPVAHGGLLPRAVVSNQQQQQQGGDQTAGAEQAPPQQSNYFNIPERVHYPSMDPQRMGAVIPGSGESSSKGSGSGTGQGYYAPPPPPQHYYQGGGQHYYPPGMPAQHGPPMMYPPQHYGPPPQYRPVPVQHNMGPPPPQQNMGPPPPQQQLNNGGPSRS